MEKRFLSLEEIADLLSVDYQLVYRLVRKGELPAVKVGRIYRVENKDFELYLLRQKSGSGFVCGSCGKSWQSTLSLMGECEIDGCTKPICIDCWERKGIRTCREHIED
ncbi:MAG: helix-turn-helix domain-containing protein [Puniceicoccaceae bacterium]